ncbi:MAG: hypothetical protein NTU53_06760 [Planctomycetota bacterium]|nr:hypothetical protein [Planctomycetota bacterium]
MFKVKIASALAFLFAAVISSLVAWGAGSVATVITLTGTVDSFAEWDSATQTITAANWTGHITAVNQSRTVTGAYHLYTNVTVTITPTGSTNSGILTNGTQTLATEYMITGGVDTPDGAYKVAGTGLGEFFAVLNTYALTHVSGTGVYDVNLLARMSSPAASAPDSGDYTCGVTLTAAW